jgi:hypothetical protein
MTVASCLNDPASPSRDAPPGGTSHSRLLNGLGVGTLTATPGETFQGFSRTSPLTSIPRTRFTSTLWCSSTTRASRWSSASAGTRAPSCAGLAVRSAPRHDRSGLQRGSPDALRCATGFTARCLAMTACQAVGSASERNTEAVVRQAFRHLDRQRVPERDAKKPRLSARHRAVELRVAKQRRAPYHARAPASSRTATATPGRT